MPYGEPEPGDPLARVAVAVEGDRTLLRSMALAFAEEFAALGFDEGRLLALFRQPFYAGPHQAYQALGEPELLELVRQALPPWRKREER